MAALRTTLAAALLVGAPLTASAQDAAINDPFVGTQQTTDVSAPLVIGTMAVLIGIVAAQGTR